MCTNKGQLQTKWKLKLAKAELKQESPVSDIEYFLFLRILWSLVLYSVLYASFCQRLTYNSIQVYQGYPNTEKVEPDDLWYADMLHFGLLERRERLWPVISTCLRGMTFLIPSSCLLDPLWTSTSALLPIQGCLTLDCDASKFLPTNPRGSSTTFVSYTTMGPGFCLG